MRGESITLAPVLPAEGQVGSRSASQWLPVSINYPSEARPNKCSVVPAGWATNLAQISSLASLPSKVPSHVPARPQPSSVRVPDSRDDDAARCGRLRIAWHAPLDMSDDAENERELRELRLEVDDQRRDIRESDDRERRQDTLITRLRDEAAVRDDEAAVLLESP